MVNTAKYFALLENLNFERAAKNNENVEVEHHNVNLSIISKYVQEDILQQLQELSIALNVPDASNSIDLDNSINCYIIRLSHVLHTLSRNINFHSDAKEDLISVAHLKLCIQATQELSFYSLRAQLDENFFMSPAFQDIPFGQLRCHRSLVFLTLELFPSLLAIRQLSIANSTELVQRDLLAVVFSLRVQPLTPKERLQLDAVLTYLWQNESKADYFRHLLLLKATPQLCAALSKEIHQHLLSRLSARHGFASLLAAFQTSNATRNAEIMANIVAQPSYSSRLQQRLIEQILDFCRLQVAQTQSLLAGVLSLRRLYELNAENQSLIENLLYSCWEALISPADLLNGLIIWDQAQLSDSIRLWEQMFCSSCVACLPSVLLVLYIPLFLQLYKLLPPTMSERKALATMITRCLDNRELKQELPTLLQRLYSWDMAGPPSWYTLHPRLTVVESDLIRIQVGQQQEESNCCRTLSTLLMAGNDHTLTCKVFLALLRLMLEQLAVSQNSSIDFVSTESELADFLHKKYQLKLELLFSLAEMVQHEPLKSQLVAVQSKPFIELVAQLLDIKVQSTDLEEQMQLLVLLLLQELLERSEQLQLAESTRRLEHPLQKLANRTKNRLLQTAVQTLLELLGTEHQPQEGPTLSSFQQARELIEDEQPHLQVYGIQLMVDALSRKDPAFVAQSHRILALALSTLKNKESYTFLNCVRLFVALVHVMESQVLDLLSDEYLSETAQLDYRLVVGEAILKAAHEIGPLCYRYKAVLFNCFLHGARSPVNEFRSSAYANLGQLCRLLAFQVHSCFQELMQLIDAELSSGRYLPAKRGALLVLAELLAGMESLLDYQDMLLPIYRLLRVIEANEDCDAQMRQHAANGLKILNEKCRDLLKTEASLDQVQREIKVFGIKDPPVKSGRRHILELN